MSTIEPTTDNLIVQRGSDLYTTTIEDMSTIQDDDLVMIGRGSESYKINGKEFKEQAGGGGASSPQIFNVTLTGSGPGFDNETYTTTVNYNPGSPAAALSLKAKVDGALSVAGNTSEIVGIGESPANGLLLQNTESTDMEGSCYFRVSELNAPFTLDNLGHNLPGFDGNMDYALWGFDVNFEGQTRIGNYTRSEEVPYTGNYVYYVFLPYGVDSVPNGTPVFEVTIVLPVVNPRVNTLLTLASDENLSNGAFVAGDTVKQNNSPIVPVSSAIVNVADSVESYITSDPTANLYNGSWDYVFNGRTDSSNTSTQSAYYYENSGSVTTTALPSGELEIYAQRPSANIGSGTHSITVGSTTVNLTDVNTPTWYNFGVQSNITEISVIGGDPGVAVYAVRVNGVVLDQNNSTILTLTDASGLSDFEVGDLVQGDIVRVVAAQSSTVTPEDYNASWAALAVDTYIRVWTLAIGDYITFEVPDGSLVEFAGGRWSGADCWCDAFSGPTADTCNNDLGTLVFGTSPPLQVSLQLPEGHKFLKLVSDSTTQGWYFYGMYNQPGYSSGFNGTNTGFYPVDTQVSITAIDAATPSISTDGGSWSGSNGTGLSGLAGIIAANFSGDNYTSGVNANTIAYNIDTSGAGYLLPFNNTLLYQGGCIDLKGTVVYHVYTSTDGVDFTRIVTTNQPSDPPVTVTAPFVAIVCDGNQDMTVTGTGTIGETFVTGPSKPITATFVSADPSVPSMTVSDVVGPWSANTGNYVENTVVNPITVKPETSAITAVTGKSIELADYASFVSSYTTAGDVEDRTVTINYSTVFPGPGNKNQIYYQNYGNVPDAGNSLICRFNFTEYGLVNDDSGIVVSLDSVVQAGGGWTTITTTVGTDYGNVTATMDAGNSLGNPDSDNSGRLTFTLPAGATYFDLGTSWSQAAASSTGGLIQTIANITWNFVPVLFAESSTTLSLTDDTDLAQFDAGDAVYAGGVAPQSFAPVIYTGNGTSQDISCGFAPDLVWIKMRNDSESHRLYDSVRGATQALYSDLTAAQSEESNALTSFNSDGFSLGNRGAVNANGNDLVAWCWDAGDTTDPFNNDGDIESIVRSNGSFSVVETETNISVGNVAIGHGLNGPPQFILAKLITSEQSWYVYHKDVGKDDYLVLDDATAKISSNNLWATSSTTFNFSPSVGTNIYYCWADSPTQSFGTYTGNNSTQKISLPFEPAFVMLKCTDVAGQEWTITDSQRAGILFPNSNSAENPTSYMTLDSDGFTLNTASGYANASGYNYIYAAFASTGGPSGVVGDITGLDMTLSESTGTWEVGQTVTMDPKSVNATTGYLSFDSGTGNVESILLSDPGFKPSPPNNALNFVDPMTGQTWDEELPAGTTLSTKVQAVNELGSSISDWASITPVPLTTNMTAAELNIAYTNAALLIATFDNRHKVHCGNKAEEERDALITKLAEAGYSITNILDYL